MDENDAAVDFQPSDVDDLETEAAGLEYDGPSTPLEARASLDPPHSEPTEAAHVKRQKGSQKSSHARRKRKREAEWELQGHDRRANVVKAVVGASAPVLTELVAADLEVAFGGYEAKRRRIVGHKVAVNPSKGLGMGFRLVRADPRK